MLNEKVGMVTEEEKKQALQLFERKFALEELLMGVSDMSIAKEEWEELYERIVADSGKTGFKLQAWWDDMFQKYNWKLVEGGHWSINFKTNEIFLNVK